VATDHLIPLSQSIQIAAALSSIDTQRALAVGQKYLKDSCRSEILTLLSIEVLVSTSSTLPV